MSAPALWTKHRPLALMLARDYYLPGSDSDDVKQEAMIALWEAARTHDPERSNFPTWARRVITCHLNDCLRVATSKRASILYLASRDVPVTATANESWWRDEIRRVVLAAEGMSQPERAALTRIIDGAPLEGKADDNLRYKVRKKLRAAA